MNTTETTEEVSLHGAEKRVERPKVNEALPLPEKNGGRTGKKDLLICGAGRNSQKRPTLVVGKKPYGKCQIKSIFSGNLSF
jgi:hypothetical protein